MKFTQDYLKGDWHYVKTNRDTDKKLRELCLLRAWRVFAKTIMGEHSYFRYTIDYEGVIVYVPTEFHTHTMNEKLEYSPEEFVNELADRFYRSKMMKLESAGVVTTK